MTDCEIISAYWSHTAPPLSHLYLYSYFIDSESWLTIYQLTKLDVNMEEKGEEPRMEEMEMVREKMCELIFCMSSRVIFPPVYQVKPDRWQYNWREDS